MTQIPQWLLEEETEAGRVILTLPDHGTLFLAGLVRIFRYIPVHVIDKLRDELIALKQRGGRLFFLGVGGSAANASHAVNDFRKLCGIECYAPTDNVAELTAWTNDAGWHTVFGAWLAESRLTAQDAVFVMSVGGGTETTSQNLALAVGYAKAIGTPILGIVGRDGGATLSLGTAVILVPTVDEGRVTPYVESMQSVLLHLICTDPGLTGA